MLYFWNIIIICAALFHGRFSSLNVYDFIKCYIFIKKFKKYLVKRT